MNTFLHYRPVSICAPILIYIFIPIFKLKFHYFRFVFEPLPVFLYHQKILGTSLDKIGRFCHLLLCGEKFGRRFPQFERGGFSCTNRRAARPGVTGRFYQMLSMGTFGLSIFKLSCRFPLSDKRSVPTNRHGGGFPTLNSYSEAHRGRRKKRFWPDYWGKVFRYGDKICFPVNLNHRKWLMKNFLINV